MCEIYEANETYEHYTYHQTSNVGNSNIHYIYIYMRFGGGHIKDSNKNQHPYF